MYMLYKTCTYVYNVCSNYITPYYFDFASDISFLLFFVGAQMIRLSFVGINIVNVRSLVTSRSTLCTWKNDKIVYRRLYFRILHSAKRSRDDINKAHLSSALVLRPTPLPPFHPHSRFVGAIGGI